MEENMKRKEWDEHLRERVMLRSRIWSEVVGGDMEGEDMS